MRVAVVFAVAGLVCVSSSRPWLVGMGLAVFVVSCLVALGHLERTSRVSVVPDAAGECAPVDPTGMSPGRRDWSPRPGDAIDRWAWRGMRVFWLASVAALLVAFLVLIGCQPNDSGTDGVVDDRCGETGVCEGSPSTDHPGCDVPGVAVFDLDGRPVCDGNDLTRSDPTPSGSNQRRRVTTQQQGEYQ